MPADALLARDFGTLAALIRAHAADQPTQAALVQGERRVSYAELDRLMDRVAAALQRDGPQAGGAIAICAGTSIEYAAAFLGALRAGVAVAPLAPSATAASLAAMVADSGAGAFFLDAARAEALREALPAIAARRIALDGSAAGAPFAAWLAPENAAPTPVAIEPSLPFHIIYSSGTTGAPKGIVQSHFMRWQHVQRAVRFGYRSDAITIVSTPLYSNTTMVCFLPTLAHGGTVVLMEKFDAAQFLALAEDARATHAMLVPVQYRRIMALPDFDGYDLTNFCMKFATSAPFPAALKADVLKRWPGGLVEYFGMTEGGGTCILAAHERPDKLHTVGRPAEGHDIRLIDADGNEVAPGEAGEVVGRSTTMMNGYHNQPALTAQALWHDAAGHAFIRTGDVGRFDPDGFLVLLDRKKDMIISGGFNIYPSDLEDVLRAHAAVAEAAVVGVPSERWGETPVGFVVLGKGDAIAADALRDWANARLGKTQRLAALEIVADLPRSEIGKVLKRELRERYRGAVA
jgi:long-chain acyl-CoA synthetase